MKINQIFQKGMILQRERELKIWGSATPKESICISIQGKKKTVQADEDGNWCACLEPLQTSFSEELIVEGLDERIVLTDVAVGEVWIAAGQSNMEFAMCYEKNFAEALKSCENDNIRFYDVPKISFDGQYEAFDFKSVGFWRKASKDDLKYFSAVGYYFQKELEKTLQVPIGIVGCNWGGTTSSAWMSEESVKKYGYYWYEKYEKQIRDMDMKAYWKEQMTCPMNDTSSMIDDPFTKFIMPRTPSIQEVGEFLASFDMSIDYLGGFQSQSIPGCLYKHMVKKLAPFVVRGVLWYQGESDDAPGYQGLYENMLSAVIHDWREGFENDELPFLIVQLPGFRQWIDMPNYDWQTIRDCQKNVTKSIANTWLCSISDVGEERDIHPKDKAVVGHRLALLARGHIYGDDIVCDAPEVKNCETTENGVVLSFSNADEGLKLMGESLQALYIHNKDKDVNYIYFIEANRLTLSFDMNKEDVTICFAQTDFYRVNLCNNAGIPVIPFQIKI